MNQKETPGEQRERLRQKELHKNPAGSLNDASNRGGTGNLTDLTGDMGWKGTALLVIVLIAGYILYKFLF